MDEYKSKLTSEGEAALAISEEYARHMQQLMQGVIPTPLPRPDPNGPDQIVTNRSTATISDVEETENFGANETSEPQEAARSALSRSFGPEAEKSMEDYKKKISIEGDEAAGIARQKAEAIKAAFSFTATPTIAPRLVEPSRPAGGQSGRSAGTTNVNINQNISGAGNPERVAAAANRRQDRAIRQARAGALYDTGAYA
jgi:hypothetical protein